MKRVLILVSALLALVVTLAACGGVSDEEFEAVQQEVTSERAMVADLKEQLAKAQATPTPLGPLAVAEAYAAAISAGDIDTLVALYADDAVFSFGPLGPEGEFEAATGKAEVLMEDLDTIADNGRLTLKTVAYKATL